MISLLLLLTGLAMAGPVDPLSPRATTCNSDNCLRAVRASAFPTRMGTQDCVSYFMTTITPAVSTVTSTLSFSVTSVVTDDVTLTTVVPITTTEVIDETATEFITTTSTPGAPVAKRQVTIIPGQIPLYASACSGSARYSSACSCIGATATIITAATPVTTTTISATVTPTTLTALSTVETDFSTTVAATLLVTTTDATTIVAVSTAIAHVPVPVGYSFTCLEAAFCCATAAADFRSGDNCNYAAYVNDGCSAEMPIALCCNALEYVDGVFSGFLCTEALT